MKLLQHRVAACDFALNDSQPYSSRAEVYMTVQSMSNPSHRQLTALGAVYLTGEYCHLHASPFPLPISVEAPSSCGVGGTLRRKPLKIIKLPPIPLFPSRIRV